MVWRVFRPCVGWFGASLPREVKFGSTVPIRRVKGAWNKRKCPRRCFSGWFLLPVKQNGPHVTSRALLSTACTGFLTQLLAGCCLAGSATAVCEPLFCVDRPELQHLSLSSINLPHYINTTGFLRYNCGLTRVTLSFLSTLPFSAKYRVLFWKLKSENPTQWRTPTVSGTWAEDGNDWNDPVNKTLMDGWRGGWKDGWCII